MKKKIQKLINDYQLQMVIARQEEKIAITENIGGGKIKVFATEARMLEMVINDLKKTIEK